jgi:hypothetical protein
MTDRQKLERILAEEYGSMEDAAEWLDDLVHECKSCEASNINNSGAAGQLDYLLAEYGFEPADVAAFIGRQLT